MKTLVFIIAANLFLISNSFSQTNDSVNFISPVKTTIWQAGNYQTVEVDCKTLYSNYELFYHKAGDPSSKIFYINVINNSGTTSSWWNISDTLSAGKYQAILVNIITDTKYYSDTFTITAANPELILTSPFSNNYLISGEKFNLIWTSISLSEIYVALSKDGGNSWDTLANNIPSHNSYSNLMQITAPVVSSTYTNCQLKIGSAGSSLTSTIYPLTLAMTSPYQFTSPGFNTYWTADSSYTVNIKNSTNDNAYVYYQMVDSSFFGNELTYINSGQNIFTWNINQFADSGKYRLVVYDYDLYQYFYSDTFHISLAPPELTILAPYTSTSTNAYLVSGQTFLLNWSAVQSGPITVEWSKNGGSTWDTIAVNVNSPTSNNDTVTLKVPIVTTTYNDCFLKITNQTQTIFSAISNITISNLSPYEFISPIKTTKWTAGDTVSVDIKDAMTGHYWYITAQSINGYGYDYSYVGYGSQESTIDINWPISNYLDSGYYRLCIYDETWYKNFYSDTFYINPAPSSLTLLTYPLTDENIFSGSQFEIEWSAVNSGNINVEVSEDKGVTWDTIAKNIYSNNSTYNYLEVTAPIFKTSTSAGILKISNSSNKLSSSVSNLTFSNKNPYTFISPTNTTSVSLGSELQVQLITNNINYNYLYIYYQQIGGFEDYNYINSIYADDSVLNTIWNIPQTIDTGKYQLYLYDDITNNYFYSDTFTITKVGSSTSLILTWPSSGTTIYSNSNFNIIWSGHVSGFLNAEVSLNEGLSWDTLARNIPGSDSTFQLTAPVFSQQVTNGMIKLSNSGNTNFSSVSNLKFYPLSSNTGNYNVIYLDNLEPWDTIGICNQLDTIKLVAMKGLINPLWRFSYNNDTLVGDTIFITGRDTGLLTCSGYNGVSWVGKSIIITSLTLYGQSMNISCGDTTRLSVISNYSGNGIPEYKWTPVTGLSNPSVSDPLATVKNDINYKVTFNAPGGCKDSTYVSVSVKPMNSPNICLVSVDSTNKNCIYWEKPISTSIDSFYVYKETNVTNIYEKIGATSYNASSKFTDISSFPSVQSNNYEISIKDFCGFESAKSNPHKTIHLAINQGQSSTWNLIWEFYEGFPVSTYFIYRGTNPDNLTLLGSTSGTSNQYTDLNAPSGYVYYQIEVVNPNNCILSDTSNQLKSDEISINISRSNIATNSPTAINPSISQSDEFSVYPNPATDQLYIKSNQGNINNGTIEIINMEGKVVLTTLMNSSNIILNISDLSKGFYTVLIKTDSGITRQKIIKD